MEEKVDQVVWDAVCCFASPFNCREVMARTGYPYSAVLAEMKKLVKLGMAVHVETPPFCYKRTNNSRPRNIDPQTI